MRPGGEDINVLIEWGLDYITILRINSYFTINCEIQKRTLSNFLVSLVGHRERVVCRI